MILSYDVAVEEHVDHHWREFVYKGDCGHSIRTRQGPDTRWSSSRPGFHRELRPWNGASPVNTEARAPNDKCCGDR